jgi:branched-chain amino acid aminotransferase
MSLDIQNRAFRYGDGLFESMFYTQGHVQFYDQHWARLLNSMEALKMNVHPKFNHLHIKKKIRYLVQQNQISGAVRIRLQVFRQSGGLYLPQTSDCGYLLEVSPLENDFYKLNASGLSVGISKDNFVAAHPLQQLKTTNKLLMVLAAIEAKTQQWDDVLLLNQQRHLVEATSSNVFILKDGKLMTPKISDGALPGIMRQELINLANRNKLTVEETCIDKNMLMEADEVFLTNAIRGIQWVKLLGNHQFTNTISKELMEILNNEILKH